jgi:hypothetical protein
MLTAARRSCRELAFRRPSVLAQCLLAALALFVVFAMLRWRRHPPTPHTDSQHVLSSFEHVPNWNTPTTTSSSPLTGDQTDLSSRLVPNDATALSWRAVAGREWEVMADPSVHWFQGKLYTVFRSRHRPSASTSSPASHALFPGDEWWSGSIVGAFEAGFRLALTSPTPVHVVHEPPRSLLMCVRAVLQRARQTMRLPHPSPAPAFAVHSQSHKPARHLRLDDENSSWRFMGGPSDARLFTFDGELYLTYSYYSRRQPTHLRLPPAAFSQLQLTTSSSITSGPPPALSSDTSRNQTATAAAAAAAAGGGAAAAGSSTSRTALDSCDALLRGGSKAWHRSVYVSRALRDHDTPIELIAVTSESTSGWFGSWFGGGASAGTPSARVRRQHTIESNWMFFSSSHV